MGKSYSQRQMVKPVLVPGFEFPLKDEIDVERLESAVQMCDSTRDLYIRFLSCMKPPKKDLVECFGLFFADSSMVRYNWSGISGHRFPKVAMMGYSIFTDCMLEAWSDQGVTMEMLQIKIKRAIEKINNRRNVQQSKLRRKARLSNIDAECSDI